MRLAATVPTGSQNHTLPHSHIYNEMTPEVCTSLAIAASLSAAQFGSRSDFCPTLAPERDW